jgi:hypothetical protein
MHKPEEILLQFITDEALALSRNGQSSFWTMNHYRIKSLIARAHKVLDEESLVDFFFHLLRLNYPPSLKGEAEFQALLTAYRRMTPLLAQRYPRNSLPRLKGLVLFGFNDLGELPAEPPLTLEHYQEYLALWRYLDSFSHVTGMLKKRPKFLELSEKQGVVKRIEKALSQSPLDDYLPFPSGSPWLWALVFLTLHVRESGLVVVRKLVHEHLAADKRTSSLEILHRYLVAADRMDLSKVLEEAESANQTADSRTTLTDFIATLGFKNTAPPWTLHVQWSTTQPSNWVISRNQLQPSDLLLTLSLTETYWNATLRRRDEKFLVQWRDSGVDVSSAELRYRRLTPWPSIAGPVEVPDFLGRLGEILGVQFVREVNVQGTLADEALSASFQDTQFRDWLSPAADDWSVFGRRHRS